METLSFSDRVYALCQQIPRGKVTTYKEIGRALGGKGQVYRAVGRALRDNPRSPHVPCHRVVKSSGELGGFKGKTKGQAITQKINLLEKEDVQVVEGKVNLQKCLFQF